MNRNRLISSASRFVRRLCTAPEEAASSSAPESTPVATQSIRPEGRLYKRLSSLNLTGGSVENVLNQYISEGKPVCKYSLYLHLKELRRFRHYQHALEIMEWMESKKYNLSYSDHAIRLDLIAKTKGIEAAENYFTELSPTAKNQLTYGALLNCYCKELLTEKAVAHFQKMNEEKIVSRSVPFNNLMTLYMRLDKPDKVLLLVDEMKQRNIPPCTFTYIIWMQSCARLNDIEGVEKVLEHMAKDNEEKCTWKTYSNLADIYVKAELFEKAELALKNMEKKMKFRSREGYHYLISLYAKTNNLHKVNKTWTTLKKALPEVNNMSYLVMLQALDKLNHIEGITKHFTEWKSICSQYDMRLVNVVIRSYLAHDKYEEEATMVFHEAKERCVGPFSKARKMFIVHFLKINRVDLAIEHLKAGGLEEKDESRILTPEIKCGFYNYFEEKGDVDGFEELLNTFKEYDYRLDSNAYQCLLRTYLSAGKTAIDMRKRLEEDGIEINEDLENLIVRACLEEADQK